MKLKNGFSGSKSQEVTARETEHRAIARRVAAEGVVLLENKGVLPLREYTGVALYGAGARHTITGGTGSGEVNCRPGVSICEGLENAGLKIVSKGWLDALDQAYEQAFDGWKKTIMEKAVPGDFESLWNTYAANPMKMPEAMPIMHEGDTDTAIYVISRVAGEGADRHPVAGDYLLSELEERQLGEVCAAYSRVIVVLNMGGVIDLGFMDRYPISALVLLGQAGMEGGNVLADILLGKVNPSGRLAETWGMAYEDYPCADTYSNVGGNLQEEKYKEGIYVGYRWFDAFGKKPRYPFGFGLSYTTFDILPAGMEIHGSKVTVKVKVTNSGSRPGKTAVLLFAACPDGLRRKERKRLAAFAKTKLLESGETTELRLDTEIAYLASWHAGRSMYFLDAGKYRLLVGRDAENYKAAGTLTLTDTVWGGKQSRICPLLDALPEKQPEAEADAKWAEELDELFRADMPMINIDREAKVALAVYSAPANLPAPEDPLVSRLTLEEKACLVCGRPYHGEVSFIGNAGVHVPGAAAETTSLLEKYGIPPTVLADGPAGIRIEQRYQVKDGELCSAGRYESLLARWFREEINFEGAENYYQFCTAIPVGMVLAQTFDTDAIEEIGGVIAREMEEYSVTWWLAPGMNIKRNPLCGRNFEYFSEDPLVAGKIAAAITRGVQAVPGAAVTIKHFACNNQEDNRRGVSSIVSERALREIYLKGFEIAVREAQPHAIMTSYNKINGVHTANSRDLCTVAARNEWGFKGLIMTDWTTTNFEGGSSAAKCVAAGNDLTMPGLESDIREIMAAVNEENDQSLSIADLDACCARILTMIRKLSC